MNEMPSLPEGFEAYVGAFVTSMNRTIDLPGEGRTTLSVDVPNDLVDTISSITGAVRGLHNTHVSAQQLSSEHNIARMEQDTYANEKMPSKSRTIAALEAHKESSMLQFLINVTRPAHVQPAGPGYM